MSGGRYFGDEVSNNETARALSMVEGYSQTKSISELLIKQNVGSSKGSALNVQIVEPGLIIGTTQEGVANKNDFL